MEEQREVNDSGWHKEVTQDKMECPVRGGVEGFAGAGGEDVVWLAPLELPLRHEQGGGGVGAGEGPLLPVADNAVSREHLRDPLGERARKQLQAQVTHGYGSGVIKLGVWDLGA